MARVISSTSEYLDRRNPARVDAITERLLKSKARASAAEQFNTVLGTAERIISSPAIVGAVSAIREGLTPSPEDLKAQAAQARLTQQTQSAALQEDRVVQNVLKQYGSPMNVPGFVLDTLTPRQRERLNEMGLSQFETQAKAQPAPAMPSLKPAAPISEAERKVPTVAEQQGLAQIEAGMAREAAGQAREERARAGEAFARGELEMARGREAEIEAAGTEAKRLMSVAEGHRQLRDIALQEGNQEEANRQGAMFLELQQQAKKMVEGAGLDWEMTTAQQRLESARAGAKMEPSPQFSAEVANVGNAIIDRGQEAVDNAKMRILQKPNPTPAEQQLLAFLEEMAPGAVGSVSRVTPTAPAAPAPEVARAPETQAPEATMAAETSEAPERTSETQRGPAELVAERIAALEAKPGRTDYENYELQLLRAQRVGPTEAPVTVSQAETLGLLGRETMPAETEAQPEMTGFDLSTPAGIYAAARMADTREKQALVLAAAQQVLRPERRATNLFEALGFGGPTQASTQQMALVSNLFPKIVTQTEKDLAQAQLSIARAEQLRQQAKLTGERAETERVMRGAKTEAELAKAFKSRASAFAELDRAKAALMRARKAGRGVGAALKKVRQNQKDSITFNYQVETQARTRHRELESEERELARVKSPGAEPTLPTVQSSQRMRAYAQEKAKWDKANADYQRAQARLASIPGEKTEQLNIIAECQANKARLLEDRAAGVEDIKRTLRKRRGGTAPAAPAPAAKPAAPAVPTKPAGKSLDELLPE